MQSLSGLISCDQASDQCNLIPHLFLFHVWWFGILFSTMQCYFPAIPFSVLVICSSLWQSWCYHFIMMLSLYMMSWDSWIGFRYFYFQSQCFRKHYFGSVYHCFLLASFPGYVACITTSNQYFKALSLSGSNSMTVCRSAKYHWLIQIKYTM